MNVFARLAREFATWATLRDYAALLAGPLADPPDIGTDDDEPEATE